MLAQSWLGRMNRWSGLLRACHPEPALAVTLCAGLLALTSGRGAGSLLVLAAVGSGQLFVGWSNDYLDRDRDRLAGRSDKPVASRVVPAASVRLAALLALAACAPLSLLLGLAAAATHAAALVSALVYNWRGKFAPWSPLPYAISFGLLPAIVSLSLRPPHLPAAWVMLAGACLGVGGHFAQVLADIPEDRRQGSRGLPQLLGQRISVSACAALLLAATLLVTLGPGRLGGWGLVALGAATGVTIAVPVSAFAGRLKLAFRLTLLVAGLAVLSFALGSGSL